MYKALILGCGNIGAMYDIDTGAIETYAKAFDADPDIAFEVYDIDKSIALRIAERYGVRSVGDLADVSIPDYDLVVVSTPTQTHYGYLAELLKRGPPLVICEKPVDTDPARLDHLLEMYGASHTKVLVNFFRRFQPSMVRLKQTIDSILGDEECTNIVITYQRGFHNNCSHAFDLLEFLFGRPIDLSDARTSCKSYDEFEADPTLSVSFDWHGTNVQCIGLKAVQFSHFEISVFFVKSAVLLKNGGNEIEMLSTPARTGRFYPKLRVQSRETGVLEDYMVNVVAAAKRILRRQDLFDNFEQSVNVSKRILKILSQ